MYETAVSRQAPASKVHRLPSKRGRQPESIPQHQRARSVQSRSRVCARNGLAVRKQHLWTKLDPCPTLGSSLQCLPKVSPKTFKPYISVQEKKYLSLGGLVVRRIAHSPHGLNPDWDLCCRSSLFSLTLSLSFRKK